ncbi:Hsp20/alpha crystallin family protein [Hallella mizrahii]|uniref:Hsp20/alpha crystallin family protein n=1 Tax=Hallella mizrahii TaxID=2606637 RepID=A0A7K0KD01_9BACT|nr:Hsp20/alpha crystallin family protein [Hallella mizrahii]
MLLAKRNDNNWMSNFFNDFFDTDMMPRMNATAPAVNVKESDKGYVMEIAAPGLKKEYCRVSIDKDGNLNLKIEDKFEHKEEDKAEDKKEHYLRREFNYSNYEQTYVLPDDVDKEKISAKVENGILTVDLPKMSKEAEKEENKSIEVK